MHSDIFLVTDRVADDQEEETYRKLASSDGRDEDLEEKPLTPMKQIESARALWRQKEEFKLEESWTSLNLFERSHKGRLSIDNESK